MELKLRSTILSCGPAQLTKSIFLLSLRRLLILLLTGLGLILLRSLGFGFWRSLGSHLFGRGDYTFGPNRGDLDFRGTDFVDLDEHENGLICTNSEIGEEALEIIVDMEREDSRVESAQHRARLKESGLTFRERISLGIRLVHKAISNSFWWFADYGYRPEKTLWTLIALLIINIGLNYSILHWQQDPLIPASEESYLQEDSDPWIGTPREYPSLNTIIFALDTLIPALDLGQETAWQPNWRNTFGIAYALFLYIVHIFFAFILIGMLVAGIGKRLSDDI